MPSDDGAEARWAEAVRGLAHRVAGPVARSIRFHDLAESTSGRHYELSAAGGELLISATDGVSASVAFHHYLREDCGVSVQWDTELPLPLTSLPDTPPRRGKAYVNDGYYLNFCTFSYTMPYWDWHDWEREIDWMALHGITMPLAITGHEAAVHAAYSRLGLDDQTIREFLGGPGYLPFQFMGCLDGFAGPMPTSWLKSHRDLGTRIVQRERAFGMTPVLPAFTGHVPRQLAPSRVTARRWQGFETHVLDPSDRLYERVGAELTRAQIEIFGTDHLYATDPFIEMPPAGSDPGHPARVAAATLAGLSAADPQATWLMQAWPFSYQQEFWTDDRVAAFLGAIPDERMIVADLWAEHDPLWRRLDRFSSKPWLWCALLNFGGRTDPIGDLHTVPAALDEALVGPEPPLGIGLSMEGTRNNPVFFELVADRIWNRITDVGDWLDTFVTQRYGRASSSELRSAWRGLSETVYDARGVRIFPEQFNGVLTAKPSYARIPDDLPELRAEVTAALWYDPVTLADAWDRMIGVAEREHDLVSGPLGHDLVEAGVAFMSRVADHLYLDAVERSVRLGRADRSAVTSFLRVFEDLDRMLATRPEFTFQHWEAKALAWSSSPEERDILADNARRIVTTWSTTTSLTLDDYAGRIWAGLVGGYYQERWSLWADGLNTAISSPGANDDELARRLRARAEQFLLQGCRPLPSRPGVLAAESRRLFDAYAGLADRITSPPVTPPGPAAR